MDKQKKESVEKIVNFIFDEKSDSKEKLKDLLFLVSNSVLQNLNDSIDFEKGE